MNEFFERLESIIDEVQRERGPLSFAAAVQRADGEVPGMYDVLVAAPWIGREMSFYEYLKPKLSDALRREDWEKLSRVLVLNPGGNFVKDFQRFIGRHTNEDDFRDIRIGDIDLRYAHLFATQNGQPMRANA